MMLMQPHIAEQLEDALLEECVDAAVENGTDIENKRFYGEEMPFVQGRMIEFSGCVFEKCTSFNVAHIHYVLNFN